VRKVFNNFTTEEKSLNREKNLCFVTDFSPDFVNRKALTRVLPTGYLHTASNIGPTNLIHSRTQVLSFDLAPPRSSPVLFNDEI
jgi:hypothetical protein